MTSKNCDTISFIYNDVTISTYRNNTNFIMHQHSGGCTWEGYQIFFEVKYGEKKLCCIKYFAINLIKIRDCIIIIIKELKPSVYINLKNKQNKLTTHELCYMYKEIAYILYIMLLKQIITCNCMKMSIILVYIRHVYTKSPHENDRVMHTLTVKLAYKYKLLILSLQQQQQNKQADLNHETQQPFKRACTSW